MDTVSFSDILNWTDVLRSAIPPGVSISRDSSQRLVGLNWHLSARAEHFVNAELGLPGHLALPGVFFLTNLAKKNQSPVTKLIRNLPIGMIVPALQIVELRPGVAESILKYGSLSFEYALSIQKPIHSFI
jgi:hypothetical protein